MPLHLKRFHGAGHKHFITFSCYLRRPYLNSEAAKELLLNALETTRFRYSFKVYGYVIMPEHVHLLMSEPSAEPLASAIQALKLSVSKRAPQKPFWLARYHDRNVLSKDERIDVLRYVHRNPVKGGLVVRPEEWKWSSFRHYLLGEASPVKLTSPLV
jgi:putative transposase